VLQGHCTVDPAEARAVAGVHLETDPVAHNLVLTLLAQRIANPEPGRYWWVTEGDDVVGFAIQTHVMFKIAATPMPRAVAETLVDAILDVAPDAPGVIADAGTASCIAGMWAERRRIPAAPHEGQRLYELTAVTPPTGVTGSFRAATTDDADLLLEWAKAFEGDTGQFPRPHPERWITDNIDHGRVSLWDDGDPVSTALVSDVIAGVSRVGFVYTPPDQRGNGYAAAVVAAVSQRALENGADRCILYTQLSNPTSNAVYQRLGYRAVSEVLDYTFG
jgi:RimJ/RimL family protein N-acetyltransferase